MPPADKGVSAEPPAPAPAAAAVATATATATTGGGAPVVPEPTGSSGRPDRKATADAAGLGRLRAVGFTAPALVLIAVFLVFPAMWTLYIGVTDFRLTGAAARQPAFVGLENYSRALRDPTFWNSLWLTMLFVLGSAVIGQNVLGFMLAYALRSAHAPLRRLVEALVLLAWILPSSVVAFLWIAMLDRDGGTVNTVLGGTTAWLVEYPMVSIILFNTWRGTAFSMMLYAAALTSVPPSHLETARLAGSGRWQTLRDVVLPHLRRYALTNTLLITLWTFNDFTPFLLTAGGPGRESEIVAAYIYNTAIVGGDMGYSGAISLLVLLINLGLALVYLRAAKVRAS